MNRERHKQVSNLITPREYVDTDENGIEYPKTNYMRSVAQKYYNMIEWQIIKTDIVYEDSKPAWIIVHGRLKWEEDGIVHTGDMVAAHRVQYSKKSGRILDLSNDIKAANTDTYKKALNFFLNICDDIYRWEDPELTEEQKETLLKLVPQNKYDAVLNAIDNTLINKSNYKLFLKQFQTKQGDAQ